jgi:hypothetical protein
MPRPLAAALIDAAGKAGHVRGVDVLRGHDGMVAESLACVKG